MSLLTFRKLWREIVISLHCRTVRRKITEKSILRPPQPTVGTVQYISYRFTHVTIDNCCAVQFQFCTCSVLYNLPTGKKHRRLQTGQGEQPSQFSDLPISFFSSLISRLVSQSSNIFPSNIYPSSSLRCFPFLNAIQLFSYSNSVSIHTTVKWQTNTKLFCSSY
jgi:hypothetical protein